MPLVVEFAVNFDNHEDLLKIVEALKNKVSLDRGRTNHHWHHLISLFIAKSSLTYAGSCDNVDVAVATSIEITA